MSTSGGANVEVKENLEISIGLIQGCPLVLCARERGSQRIIPTPQLAHHTYTTASASYLHHSQRIIPTPETDLTFTLSTDITEADSSSQSRGKSKMARSLHSHHAWQKPQRHACMGSPGLLDI